MKQIIAFVAVLLSLFLIGCTSSPEYLSPLAEEEPVTEPQVIVAEEPEPAVVEVEEIPLEQEQIVHFINLTNRGFEPDWVDMQLNDSISLFVDKRLDYGRVVFVGVQRCGELESGVLGRGDTFNWTPVREGRCHIVEARSSSKVLKLNVE